MVFRKKKKKKEMEGIAVIRSLVIDFNKGLQISPGIHGSLYTMLELH